jgi:hypothetical protein
MVHVLNTEWPDETKSRPDVITQLDVAIANARNSNGPVSQADLNDMKRGVALLRAIALGRAQVIVPTPALAARNDIAKHFQARYYGGDEAPLMTEPSVKAILGAYPLWAAILVRDPNQFTCRNSIQSSKGKELLNCFHGQLGMSLYERLYKGGHKSVHEITDQRRMHFGISELVSILGYGGKIRDFGMDHDNPIAKAIGEGFNKFTVEFFNMEKGTNALMVKLINGSPTETNQARSSHNDSFMRYLFKVLYAMSLTNWWVYITKEKPLCAVLHYAYAVAEYQAHLKTAGYGGKVVVRTPPTVQALGFPIIIFEPSQSKKAGFTGETPRRNVLLSRAKYGYLSMTTPGVMDRCKLLKKEWDLFESRGQSCVIDLGFPDPRACRVCNESGHKAAECSNKAEIDAAKKAEQRCDVSYFLPLIRCVLTCEIDLR